MFNKMEFNSLYNIVIEICTLIENINDTENNVHRKYLTVVIFIIKSKILNLHPRHIMKFGLSSLT